MSPLQEAVTAAFGSAGPLASVDVNYIERAVQVDMALGVAEAIDDRSVLVVEAGTGVGKTFAYLVPLLLSGCRAMLSTATKNLQDQLFLRDVPRLRAALRMPISVALLKGRASYLCLHRLGQARQSIESNDRWTMRTLSKIEQWSAGTSSGDLAELEGLDERSSVLGLVTSTRDNCLGSECPEYRQCHVMKARREAMAADLVIVNHHLFFADMQLRDSGVAELLPSVDIAIFDEAHQLSEAGIPFLGKAVGTAQLIDFSRDMLGAGLQLARGLAQWQELASQCEHAARDLRIAIVGPARDSKFATKLRWSDRAGGHDFESALEAVSLSCNAATEALDTVSELAPDFVRLAERARKLAELAARFLEAPAKGQIRWIDLSPHQARLVESPLDIRDALQSQMAVGAKAWIFTSATLGDDARLSWFTEPAGLEEARMLRLGSPFDYTAHARFYVPRPFAKPGEPEHPTAVAKLAVRLARALGGRTFVLTTTLRALKTVGERMREDFEAGGDGIQVLVQGQTPKRQLMQQFLAHPRSVLVGSQSFWEGVDVPGDALQCVIIDKLPFPPPGDPLVEARVKRLEAEGRNPFTDYFVAEAAVSLKQGAGRLIRSETDRGLLVICDPRTLGQTYGKRLQQALPPMTLLSTESAALAWLAELAEWHVEPAAHEPSAPLYAD